MRLLLATILIVLSSACAFAQQSDPAPVPAVTPSANPSVPAEPQGQPVTPSSEASGSSLPGAPKPSDGPQDVPASKQQPKRILGVMPNFRAVSPGQNPPPPSFKQSLKIATQNSFDYSSFIFVGITSALAEATDAHPELGKGMGGFGQYYWRGFVDKTDGNYWVISILPTVFRQDTRYYAMGEGGFWKRSTYAATRIFVARKYDGDNTFNISEVLGRGIAQGISTTYYPSASNTGEKLIVKYAYALGRDALTNVFREFWPDIATHVLHRHP